MLRLLINMVESKAEAAKIPIRLECASYPEFKTGNVQLNI